MDSSWVVETPEERVARFFGPHPAEKSSEETWQYNCIAWAVGENHRRWDPTIERGRKQGYWPDDVGREPTIENLMLALEKARFEDCGTDGEFEAGFEKIALTEDEGEWQHACRVLEDGRFWSKCGDFEDVKHDKAGLESLYGPIVRFMKRTIL